MEDVRWVQVSDEAESWHIFDEEATPELLEAMGAAPGSMRTACGLIRELGDVLDERPPNEKTCENCFRLRGPS